MSIKTIILDSDTLAGRFGRWLNLRVGVARSRRVAKAMRIDPGPTVEPQSRR